MAVGMGIVFIFLFLIYLSVVATAFAIRRFNQKATMTIKANNKVEVCQEKEYQKEVEVVEKFDPRDDLMETKAAIVAAVTHFLKKT